MSYRRLLCIVAGFAVSVAVALSIKATFWVAMWIGFSSVTTGLYYGKLWDEK